MYPRKLKIYSALLTVYIVVGLFANPEIIFAQKHERVNQLEFPQFKLPYEQNNTKPVKWTGGPHAFLLGGNFGAKYFSGEGSGLDFSNGDHFEVLNMASGEVVEATCTGYGSLGCIVAVQHDFGGTVMIYAHLDPSSVKTLIEYFKFKRDYHRGPLWLSQGSVIGKAGKSGNDNQPIHLHIELREGNRDENGNWVCHNIHRQCVTNNLGGEPIGWDDGLFLVDGYQIFGYIADAEEGIESYNYDGSAVKGAVKLIEDFSFVYTDNGKPNWPEVVRVGEDFSCHYEDPNDPKKDCELPQYHLPQDTKLTQFARDDGKSGIFSNALSPSLNYQESSSIPYSAGILESTNIPGILEPPAHISDFAAFVTDISLPDGTIVSPNQTLIKTWRLQNSGSTSWGSGYQLVFLRGDRMGAPAAINVPSTAPGQSVDISVSISSPTSNGKYKGYWRLRNPQGTYFGPEIWVSLEVANQGSHITVFSADPPPPSDTTSVRIRARVENFPNFRALRMKVGNQVICEETTLEATCSWNTTGYGTGSHNIIVEIADHTDSSWSRSEKRSMVYTLTGTGASSNHIPNRPSLVRPYDWFVFNSGNTAELCAQHNGDPDGNTITGYYFEIFDSAQLWNSGWISSSCVTTPTLGYYGYKWHVKVRDSYNAESNWSDSWNFNIVDPTVRVTELYFQQQDPNSEQVKIRACSTGAGSGTLRVMVNEANDGSDSGKWNIIYELGTPCFGDNDAPTWHTLGYENGTHRVRVEARKAGPSWEGAAYREELYNLPNRRPAGPAQFAPVPQSRDSQEAIYLNSRTVTFKWGPTLRTNNYVLHVGTSPNPQAEPNPVLRQTVSVNSTEYTATFNQDYQTLYWQVTAVGGAGSSNSNAQKFGIDRSAPSCSVSDLPAVTYENAFNVAWGGSDSSAGIQQFDVQFLDSERGDWIDWLTNQPPSKTFNLFIGQPGHTYKFRCGAMDYAGNVGNYATNGDTFTKVDPAARPQEPWWNNAYSYKRNLVIINNDGDWMPPHFPVLLHFDSKTTPTSAEIYSASQTATKGNDVRIVYQNQTELNRMVQRFTSSQIDIWLPLQQGLGSGASDSTNYQLYYGNSSAGSPPSDVNAIFMPVVDSNTVGLWHFQEGSGTTVYDNSGRNHNGSFSNGGFSDGFGGWAGSFNGTNSTVSLGNNPDFDYLNAFTFETWVYFSEGSWSVFLVKHGQVTFRMTNDNSIEFTIAHRDGSGGSSVSSNTKLEVGRWYHIAGVHDGANSLWLYINGALDRSRTDARPVAHANNPLYFGNAPWWDGTALAGMMQHTRISNTARHDFPYARIDNQPSVAAGVQQTPPVVGSPDLAVISLNTFPNPNGGMLVEAVVKNLGNVSTTNGFYTDLYINHLPSGAGDYTSSLQFWVNDPIPAGSTATLTTVITDLSQLGLGLAATTPGEEKRGTLYVQADSTGALSETDKANNITASGTEICVVSPDAFEGDKTFESAHLLDSSQLHNFDRPNDEDWVKLVAKQGEIYKIQTSNLGSNTDTYLYLYDTDGTTLLASNDDYGGSLASQIKWTAPADGTYYLQVKQWNPSMGGCGTSYTIGTVNEQSVYLPFIRR